MREYLEDMVVVGKFAAAVGHQQLAFDQSALMEQGVEQIGEMPALREDAPFQQSVEHRLRRALVVKPLKVSVIDGEKTVGPDLSRFDQQPGWSIPRSGENPGGLARLEQPVLLVEGVRDAGLTQVPGDLGAVAIGSRQDVNVLGGNFARILFFVTNCN